MNHNISDKSVSRRDFLKVAAVGTLGNFILQQQMLASQRSEDSESPRTISIIGLVDVMQALAERNVAPNAYWIDNNRLGGSRKEGTNSLITRVTGGDIVKWVVVGLEVETSVHIRHIHGPITSISTPTQDKDSMIGGWTATIDTTKKGVYSYMMDFSVEGVHMPMASNMVLEVV